MEHIMEKSQSSICHDEVPCFLAGNSRISLDTSSAFSSVISWVAVAKDQYGIWLQWIWKRGTGFNHIYIRHHLSLVFPLQETELESEDRSESLGGSHDSHKNLWNSDSDVLLIWNDHVTPSIWLWQCKCVEQNMFWYILRPQPHLHEANIRQDEASFLSCCIQSLLHIQAVFSDFMFLKMHCCPSPLWKVIL